MTNHWAILTGEYPPQFGGVADYTAQVAEGLTAAGDRVRVFAPPCPAAHSASSGVDVVRLPDNFGPRGLASLDRTLERDRPDRVLVQYVPHAFGCKAMNVLFAAWVAARAGRFAPVWVMFHEVAFPFRWRPATHAVLGVVSRVMARLVAGAADRLFVSTASWGPRLAHLCPRAATLEWLPIPSNMPCDPAGTKVRSAVGPVIGHFGTYGPATAPLLTEVLPRVLATEDRTAVLLGRGGQAFRDTLALRHPALAPRLVALGNLAERDVADRLRGCDVLLQPFIDGISTRRTSAMAGLANGVPVVSNLGELSEPLWSDCRWPTLAPDANADALTEVVEAVLNMSPERREALGRAGVALYLERFALEATVARLRGEP